MAHKHKPIAEQVIVITGASSGIGLATALLAAERGAKLVLAARSGGTLDQIVLRINADGKQAIAVAADVGDRKDVERIAAAAIEKFGRIDTWVNDAGVSIYGRLDEVSDADNRRLFETNFWGVVNGSLTALEHLKKNGGALVNVGSEVSEAVIPLQGMYSASKHAVKGFTDALRVEIERIDKAPVTIALIQPTAVDTPYPQNARNYMEREPKLPDPKIDPLQVAQAILDAAENGGRDIKVGAMAKLNTALSHVLPRLADRLAALQTDSQKRPQRPQRPLGTLYEAGESGQVYGRAEP